MIALVRKRPWLRSVFSLAVFFLVSCIGIWFSRVILGPDPSVLLKGLAVLTVLLSYLYGWFASIVTGAILSSDDDETA